MTSQVAEKDITEVNGNGQTVVLIHAGQKIPEGFIFPVAPEETAATEIKVSAAAEKLAEEKGVDLATITGTGKDGAITKTDVEDAAENAEETAD